MAAPVYARWASGLVVAAGFFVLAVRQLLLVDRNAVNVLFWDQWDFYRPLFEGGGIWKLFDYEHPPHRQGLGMLVTAVLARLSGWNSRWDAFAVSGALILGAALAVVLARRCGARGLALLAVPLIFFNVHQFETLVGPANLSHGAMPDLLLMGYGLIWFIPRRAFRQAAAAVLTFLLIFTGFGLFVGLITPVVEIIEGIQALRARRRGDAGWAGLVLGATVLSWTAFFWGYHFNPAVAGFRFPYEHPGGYFVFAAAMLGHFYGIDSGRRLYVIGFASLALLAYICGSTGWRFARRGVAENPRSVALFALSAFGLLYCVDTAIGRVFIGLAGAFAPRYVTLMVPGSLAVLLFLAGLRSRRWAWVLTLGYAVWLVPTTCRLSADETNAIRYYASGRRAWKAAYLRCLDPVRATQISGFEIYPLPAALAGRLSYLKENRLNLFRRKSDGAHVTGGFRLATGSFDPGETRRLGKRMPLWQSKTPGTRVHAGRIEFGPFESGRALGLWLAGCPAEDGETLYLSRPDTKSRLELTVRCDPGDRWTIFRWTLPPAWRNRPVTLVAEDRSADPNVWIALSPPQAPAWQFGPAFVGAGAELMVSLALLLPGLGTLLWSSIRDASTALGLILVGSGLVAYALFFIYFASPRGGIIASWMVLSVGVATLILRWRALRGWLRRRDFVAPIALASITAAFYFSGGFLYGGLQSPAYVSAERFLRDLPADPLLPHWLANVMARGLPLRPFFADWLTSDRPPLQAGINLILWPFASGDLGYEMAGIAAQSWIWIGLWVALRRLNVSMRSTVRIFYFSIFSGLFFLNSFYCWPKLLPAAFLLICVACLFGAERERARHPSQWLLAAAAAALAMEGHGGSAFGLLGIAVVFLLVRRPSPGVRAWLASGAVFGLILLPWHVYRIRVDPPGDRLIKYHLAGHTAIDPRPSWVVIREAYAEAGWREVIENKLANFRAIFCGNVHWFEQTGGALRLARSGRTGAAWRAFAYAARQAGFFHYLQTLGPLTVGLLGILPALLRKGPDPDRSALGIFSALFCVTACLWCLLMFHGDTTLIHQSSYLMAACLFAAAALAAGLLPRWALAAMGIANLVWFAVIWIMAPARSDAYPPGLLPASFPGFGLAMLACGIAIGAVLGRLSISNGRRRPGEGVSALP